MMRSVKLLSMVVAASAFLAMNASESQAFWWGCCSPSYSCGYTPCNTCYSPCTSCCSPCNSCGQSPCSCPTGGCSTGGCSTGGCATGSCGASLTPATNTVYLFGFPQQVPVVSQRTFYSNRQSVAVEPQRPEPRRTAIRRPATPATKTSRLTNSYRTSVLDASVAMGRVRS